MEGNVIDARFNVAGTVIECARQQSGKALYVAFAFLAGTRPSEQLGLLWEDVDFEPRQNECKSERAR
jgi:hypothetical protein